jgi:hypothetical protein
MFSTSGRRRALTDAQVSRILEWQRNRKTLGQVARENRVSRRTIYRVLEESEVYKSSAPPTRLVSGSEPKRRGRPRGSNGRGNT